MFFYACSNKYIDHDYSNITVNINISVEKSKPNFLIFPINCPSSAESAIIFPFKIEQNITHNRKYLSFELTKVLYSAFLKNITFTKLILNDTFVDSIDDAISLAKKENCDLIIIPYINYILFGGTSGSTIISLKIDIYDTQSKKLLWSITHMGKVGTRLDRDYIFLKTHYEIPYFIESIIICELAKDISVPIRLWNKGDCTNYYKSINLKSNNKKTSN